MLLLIALDWLRERLSAASSLFLEEAAEALEDTALGPADLETGLHFIVILLHSLSEEPLHPNCSSDTRSKDDGCSRRVASIQLKINYILIQGGKMNHYKRKI